MEPWMTYRGVPEGWGLDMEVFGLLWGGVFLYSWVPGWVLVEGEVNTYT